MRKLPNGKYMYDTDPPWANKLADIVLTSFVLLLLILPPLLHVAFNAKNGWQAIVDPFKNLETAAPVILSYLGMIMGLFALWRHRQRTD